MMNTNVFSQSVQRYLMKTNNLLQTSMQRLSSGVRINSAADDAAGLKVANIMSAKIGGFSAAIRNANDGISLAQIAEGAMAEVSSIILRMRDLAVQASSGTYSDTDLDAMDLEFQALHLEIDRITGSTEFNGQNLLGGGTFTIAINPDDGSGVDIVIANLSAVAPAGDLQSSGNAATAIGAADTALETVDAERAAMGAAQSRLSSAISHLSNMRDNLSASRSRIMDTDFAVETANFSKYQIMQQSALAVLAQANTLSRDILYLLGRS
ncbi:MAG: flagellin [Endozoicomonas sp. (ex Botrylloides leachii)]|nr:flagellin [Endozoicomonas sp. (ex Botrylloides leachii)]